MVIWSYRCRKSTCCSCRPPGIDKGFASTSSAAWRELVYAIRRRSVHAPNRTFHGLRIMEPRSRSSVRAITESRIAGFEPEKASSGEMNGTMLTRSRYTMSLAT